MPAALGVSVREAAEAMSRVLDETADGGQRPGVLVGELPQQPGELRGGVSHVGLRGGAPGEPGGRIRVRASGPGRDEVQLGLDAPALGGQEREKPMWLRCPCAVRPDEVGEQIEAFGLCLNGDPTAALIVAGALDAGGTGDPVGDLGPLGSGEVAVVGGQAHVRVPDGAAVTVRAGGEGCSQVGSSRCSAHSTDVQICCSSKGV
ncbi:hypothetical protein [Streptomyces pratensis]|uniref:hypothetical protein n=1 Tax=Streptomyces pratensis TaxID=1169025 RepID=UPI003635E260